MFPKTLLTIDYVFAVRGVSGNYILLAFIAFPLVKLSFVSERKSPFLPAFRAIRRPRQIFFKIKLLFLRYD